MIHERRKIVFTWDDNCNRHYKYIGPLFKKYGIRCSFYINPGWKSFKKRYLNGYKKLDKDAFEIGSHGYMHKHMISLSREEYEKQLVMSQQLLQEWFGHKITTFAFPHHEYTEEMLVLARKYYAETRNTVPNSVRYSLKSHTTLEDISKIAYQTAIRNQTLIFSGHSVAINSNEISSYSKSAGYEPVLLSTLEDIIKLLLINNSQNDFFTLSELVTINLGECTNERKF